VLRRAQPTPFFRIILNTLLFEGGLKAHFVSAVGSCQSKTLYFALREMYLEFMRGEVEENQRVGNWVGRDERV
jgi:hypothetical protein